MMFQLKKTASLKVIYYPFDGSGLIAKGGSSGSPGPSPTIRHCFASTIYKSLAQTWSSSEKIEPFLSTDEVPLLSEETGIG